MPYSTAQKSGALDSVAAFLQSNGDVMTEAKEVLQATSRASYEDVALCAERPVAALLSFRHQIQSLGGRNHNFLAVKADVLCGAGYRAQTFVSAMFSAALLARHSGAPRA